MPFEVIIDGTEKITVNDEECNKLGHGGQGDVYRINYKGQDYALKWYHAKEIINNPLFKEILKKNTQRKSPDSCFLWPKHFAESNNGGYGYIMDLIDTRFTSFSNIYNGKKRIEDPITGKKRTIDIKFNSFNDRITVALKIVNAFRILHRNGLAYQDINDGSFFIDLNNCDVLVCDCDNIMPSSVDDSFRTVNGKPGFMAPEIISKNAKPCTETDRHSLAVLMYYLFLTDKPFEGQKTAGQMFTEETSFDIYGENAIFVMDPDDNSNRPPKNSNSAILWPQLPEQLQNVFIKAFVDGLKVPTKRPTVNKWIKVINNMRASFVKCSCGDENFIGPSNIINNKFCCPNCKKQYTLLTVKHDTYAVFPGNNLFSISLGGENINQIIGTIASNNNGDIGLVNRTNQKWTVFTPSNVIHKISPGNGFPLLSGTSIQFNAEETDQDGHVLLLEENGTVE